MSGTATYSDTNNYEQVARELGIRTEILFIKSVDDYYANGNAFDDNNYIIEESRENNTFYIGKQKDFVSIRGESVRDCVSRFKPHLIKVTTADLW